MERGEREKEAEKREGEWDGKGRKGEGGGGIPSERKNTGHDFLFLTLKSAPAVSLKG